MRILPNTKLRQKNPNRLYFVEMSCEILCKLSISIIITIIRSIQIFPVLLPEPGFVEITKSKVKTLKSKEIPFPFLTL